MMLEQAIIFLSQFKGTLIRPYSSAIIDNKTAKITHEIEFPLDSGFELFPKPEKDSAEENKNDSQLIEHNFD